LLVSVKDIENYKKIRYNLEKLKVLVEEVELWVQTRPHSSEVRRRRRGISNHVCVWGMIKGGNIEYMFTYT